MEQKRDGRDRRRADRRRVRRAARARASERPSAMGLGLDEMTRADARRGLIGVLIAARSTFAAEVCGCQAECGAGSGMAAAALVTLAGAERPTGGCRCVDGPAERPGPGLRSGGQPGRGALPGPQRDGRQQRTGLRQHGPGRL